MKLYNIALSIGRILNCYHEYTPDELRRETWQLVGSGRAGLDVIKGMIEDYSDPDVIRLCGAYVSTYYRHLISVWYRLGMGVSQECPANERMTHCITRIDNNVEWFQSLTEDSNKRIAALAKEFLKWV